jgi:paired amphipathic helix protein Sin3a
MRKNQYEEALFRCEDDRFELDMAIETSLSAIRAMTPLAEEVNARDGEDKMNYRIPAGALSPVHYRAIQKIYGMPLPSHFFSLVILWD